jgi:hypothetical protein
MQLLEQPRIHWLAVGSAFFVVGAPDQPGFQLQVGGASGGGGE